MAESVQSGDGELERTAPSRSRFADCTLRDGEQQAGVVMDKTAKVEIAKGLERSPGSCEIEAGHHRQQRGGSKEAIDSHRRSGSQREDQRPLPRPQCRYRPRQVRRGLGCPPELSYQ